MESSCARYFCFQYYKGGPNFVDLSTDSGPHIGFSLLRNAGYEAQQHDADTPLVRSLFITGLLYILEALPADLSEDEISAIRVKMPNTTQSSNLHARPSDNRTLYIGDGRAVTHTDQPSQPSLIHRILASSIIQFCL